MRKKSFWVPVVLSLVAILVTGVPLLIFGDNFLKLAWWPVPLAVSFGLVALAIVAEICLVPVPLGYRVYGELRQMDINYGSMFPVVLKRGMPDGSTARIRFAEVEGELLITDYSSGISTMTSEQSGLVRLQSGNFMVTKLPKHFRVTWSHEAWVEDGKDNKE